MNNTKQRKMKLKPFSQGELFVVATPIGNLKDFTYRAVEILNEVDLIACEDTRQTRKLLNHYGIKTKCIAFHEHSKEHELNKILDKLQSSQKIAIVSDAGTPLISDPGHDLVSKFIALGGKVTPIPGPCAATAAISACGLPSNGFLFYGFLPNKVEKRKTILQDISKYENTIIFYESPNRVKKLLEGIMLILGDREIVIARELTKLYEEFIRGKVSEVLNSIEKLKGECVILVEGSAKEDVSEEQIIHQLGVAMKEMSIKDAVSLVSETHNYSKKKTYNLALMYKK